MSADHEPVRCAPGRQVVGGMARKSVIGAPPGRPYPQTNGWSFSHYRDAASGELSSVDELGRQHLQQQV